MLVIQRYQGQKWPIHLLFNTGNIILPVIPSPMLHISFCQAIYLILIKKADHLAQDSPGPAGILATAAGAAELPLVKKELLPPMLWFNYSQSASSFELDPPDLVQSKVVHWYIFIGIVQTPEKHVI